MAALLVVARPARLIAAVIAVAIAAGALSGCDTDSTTKPGSPEPSAQTVPSQLAAAVSEPVEDSVYPDVGDPGVDALHYQLDLAWAPRTKTLRGVATLVFRSTTTADHFQLDLGEPLQVSTVTLDGGPVEFAHEGKNLVVTAPVAKDASYTAVITYRGTPQPVAAPTTRGDFDATGWTVDATDRVWTMQEPYGAFTWYPVNDQPSDKAFYDFTIRVPSRLVGIANGALTSRSRVGRQTVTQFHLDQPAAAYLTTIAIGDYASSESVSSSGVPITLWAPREDRRLLRKLRYLGPALTWIEGRLGRYPFETAGAVVVGSASAMETQALLTLGNLPYSLSREVIVHELIHQWYGDLVTPSDWRDLWMNEGMATYLQMVYRAETTGPGLEQTMRQLADYSASEAAGPPGDYDPRMFGEANVYYRPARMWHALRKQVGDEEFWALVRDWPREHAGGNATREDWLAWLEDETGKDLDEFFRQWLLDDTPPT